MFLSDADFLWIKGEWKCKFVYDWTDERIANAKKELNK